MKLLLANGADVNTRDKRGRTALMWAVLPTDDYPRGSAEGDPITWQRKLLAMQLLLEGGANVNARDGRGWTALMYALETYGRVPEDDLKAALAPIKLLLSRGADANVRATDGTTALKLARKEYDVTQVLRQAGAR
jgi:ankyrin repeat protein